MNAISANDTDLPITLSKHLVEMTNKAQQLQGIIHALNACIDYPEHRNLCLELIQSADKLAPDLLHGLDSADMRFPR